MEDQRWTLEQAFNELTTHLRCELNTLGYPKAALFAFCVALMAYSVLAVVNAPPPPASPGSYDFARDAYFESVGGVGFALGPARSWATDLRPPWRLRLTIRS